ncbi:uncharacterized protein LOC112577355 isoform X2 [Pomacea canaliculata]|uniref:uncharacterized protein LOC112577355 isoform X2 n=1 Tax=Pomacea canaliculata TaxID=400727 RepID=UPI000D730B2B|nr:uncharacterized protein LOC112577355 isoform X2 [Pomacea canaliculata]
MQVNGQWMSLICLSVFWSQSGVESGCGKGFYGLNCSLTCGECRNGETCNSISGWCRKGCRKGWTPDTLCNKAIHKKCTGGWDCIPCGHCLTADGCNYTTGHCTDGCQPNWHGKGCFQEGTGSGDDYSPFWVNFFFPILLLLLCIIVVFFSFCDQNKDHQRHRRSSEPDDPPAGMPHRYLASRESIAKSQRFGRSFAVPVESDRRNAMVPGPDPTDPFRLLSHSQVTMVNISTAESGYRWKKKWKLLKGVTKEMRQEKWLKVKDHRRRRQERESISSENRSSIIPEVNEEPETAV